MFYLGSTLNHQSHKKAIIISAFLIGSILAMPVIADPGVNGSFSLNETVNTKKSIRKIWSNFLAGYQQARNAAQSMVRQMQLTASLANSMEQNLIAWESVAKRTEALLHADIWDENPITEIEKLEENLFQKSDDLLYNRIPNARQSSKNLNKVRRDWVNGLGWGDDPVPGTVDKSLREALGFIALSPGQRPQQSRDKTTFDIRNGAIAKSGARQDQMVYMADNTDAHLSALGTSLAKLETSDQKTISDMNVQLSENDFVQGQMEVRQNMDKLELYTHILLTKASDYNRMGLAAYATLQPLLLLSDELERQRGR